MAKKKMAKAKKMATGGLVYGTTPPPKVTPGQTGVLRPGPGAQAEMIKYLTGRNYDVDYLRGQSPTSLYRLYQGAIPLRRLGPRPMKRGGTVKAKAKKRG